MPAYNPGGYEGTSTSQMGLNPDGGGIGGLFAEGADWFNGTISDILESGNKILKGIQDYKWSDLQFDLAKTQLQQGQQAYNPTSAPAATYFPATGGIGGSMGSLLLIGGAILAAVILIPKIMK